MKNEIKLPGAPADKKAIIIDLLKARIDVEGRIFMVLLIACGMLGLSIHNADMHFAYIGLSLILLGVLNYMYIWKKYIEKEVIVKHHPAFLSDIELRRLVGLRESDGDDDVFVIL